MAYDSNIVNTIIQVGRAMSMGDDAITAALSTAMVESGMRTGAPVRYRDADSAGPFQQRPSRGWGALSQVEDPRYAATKFYETYRRMARPGLPGWEVAANVQRPAARYRGRYQQRWGEAQQLFSRYGGGKQVQRVTPLEAGKPPVSVSPRSGRNVNDLFRESEDMWKGIFGQASERIKKQQLEADGRMGRVVPRSGADRFASSRSNTAKQAAIYKNAVQARIAAQRGQAGLVGADPGGGAYRGGDWTPSNARTPGGLRPNAARGAQVARQLGFSGSIGGIGKRSGPSDHPAGNAIDLMTHGDVNIGWRLSNHYVQNRAQLGVKYVIFQQQIASASSGWRFRRMADRGSATANHMDHPHISFT